MVSPLKHCRVCGNTNLVQVLDLGEQALTGVFPSSKSNRVTRGPMVLVKCHSDDVADSCCGLLQLGHHYDLTEMYGDNYGYRSSLNPSMIRHLSLKVERILSIIELAAGDLVLDIGSNDGTTLRQYAKGLYQLVGIDPTADKFRQYYRDDATVIPDFFNQEVYRTHYPDQQAKIITSFSMFYDLEEPLTFMNDIVSILADDGVWVFEQSYMPAMLERNSLDTVCQEHLEYYDLRQIHWMVQKIGLKIIEIEFNEINGGSFSITAAKSNSPYPEASNLQALLVQEATLDLDTLKPFYDFAERSAAARDALRHFLKTAKLEGKSVYGLGASTKGNVLLQYCGIDENDIVAIGEVNADKFNCFTPGSLIPIVSEDVVLQSEPDYIVILPWHFRDFFLGLTSLVGQKLVFPLPKLDIVEVQ